MVRNTNKVNIILCLMAIIIAGCTRLPETPDIKVDQAWAESYGAVIKHVVNCDECRKSFSGQVPIEYNMEVPIASAFNRADIDSVFGGKFSKCTEYLEIYKRSTTFGDWQLYPMGWQYKGPTQQKYIWDYEKQQWLRK